MNQKQGIVEVEHDDNIRMYRQTNNQRFLFRKKGNKLQSKTTMKASNYIKRASGER